MSIHGAFAEPDPGLLTVQPSDTTCWALTDAGAVRPAATRSGVVTAIGIVRSPFDPFATTSAPRASIVAGWSFAGSP